MGNRIYTRSRRDELTVALKKSELYSSLWSSCDELRGGMDASQYKDYVLVLLFIKYVSDKFAGRFTDRSRDCSSSRRLPGYPINGPFLFSPCCQYPVSKLPYY
jgi:hypothetical protein